MPFFIHSYYVTQNLNQSICIILSSPSSSFKATLTLRYSAMFFLLLTFVVFIRTHSVGASRPILWLSAIHKQSKEKSVTTTTNKQRPFFSIIIKFIGNNLVKASDNKDAINNDLSECIYRSEVNWYLAS